MVSSAAQGSGRMLCRRHLFEYLGNLVHYLLMRSEVPPIQACCDENHHWLGVDRPSGRAPGAIRVVPKIGRPLRIISGARECGPTSGHVTSLLACSVNILAIWASDRTRVTQMEVQSGDAFCFVSCRACVFPSRKGISANSDGGVGWSRGS